MSIEDNFVRCPKCNEVMVLRNGPNGEFYGCQLFPKCKGTRSIESGNGKEFLKPTVTYGYGDQGKCMRCGQYPAHGGSLSAMGLCPSCQERYDDE